MSDSTRFRCRKGLVHVLSVATALALLIGASLAQGFHFESTKEKKEFWALQEEILEITQTIARIEKIQGKTGESERSLSFLRRRLLERTQSAMALVVSKREPGGKQQAGGMRRLPLEEEKLRQRADLKARVLLYQGGMEAFTKDARSVQIQGLVPLDHPALGAFPDKRFYLVNIKIQPGREADKAGKSPARPMAQFVYQLAVFDRKSDKIKILHGFAPRDVVGPILAAGNTRAPTKDIAEDICLARTVLVRASMGASVFRPVRSDGLTQQEIDRRFGLGKWADSHVSEPHGYLETDKEGVLLSWRLHSDDFGMPQRLMFEWMRFDRKDGHWLGMARKAGPLFDSRKSIDSPQVEKAVMKFASDLLHR